MRKPYLPPRIFQQRRQKLSALVPGAAVVLPAWPEFIRNHDGHFPYRQESGMLYLTGFDEPGSCLIFRPGCKPETVMFVRPKNIERETWDGFRYGVDGAKQEFGFDEVYSIDEFESVAPKLLKECQKVYYSLYRNHEFDEIFGRVLTQVKWLNPRAGLGFLPVEDAYGLLGEMRIRKSEEEIDMLRRAGSVSARAHIEVMKATKPNVSERALHGLFIKSIMEQGAQGEAYTGIFAGGNNACTLHYRFNEDKLNDGDLLLVDAGAEYMFYSGDITRTYPVNGKFSAPQRRIYQAMLDLQLKLIAMIRPGLPHARLQEETVKGVTEIMLEEKLISGTLDECIRNRAYAKYYPHGVSHLLGLDTHDAGALVIGGKSRDMEPGWCFTIEPGIYIPANDSSAPKELRGIGIRIEDDVICTNDGVEVLTHEVPKSVAEMEAIIGQA